MHKGHRDHVLRNNLVANLQNSNKHFSLSLSLSFSLSLFLSLSRRYYKNNLIRYGGREDSYI